MWFWKKKKIPVYCPKCGGEIIHREFGSKFDAQTGLARKITHQYTCPLIDSAGNNNNLIWYLLTKNHTCFHTTQKA